MSEKTPLYSYVSQALTASGAVVDPQDELLQCLLPSHLAQALVSDDELTLKLPSSEKDGDVLNYEHPVLEHLFDHIQQDGRLTHLELTDLTSRSGGLRNVFQRTVQLSQGIGEIDRIYTSHCTYLLMHFQLDAHCQEHSYSDILSIACNEETLVKSPWLTDEIANWPHKKVSPQFWKTPFPSIYTHLQSSLDPLIDKAIEPFAQRIHQSISLERRRQERLHRRERKAILQPLRDDPSQDPEPVLQALQEAEDQYKETLHAIPARYPIALHTQPLAALRVTIPITRVDYNIRLRKESRNVSWIWNPIVEQFEPLRCEQCETERYHIVPTSDLALHCPRCAD